MNCFDCSASDRSTEAVAICSGCGAAVCLDHATVTARWLTRTAAINRTIVVGPPTRTLMCRLCHEASAAAS
jgi:hypothetical protein